MAPPAFGDGQGDDGADPREPRRGRGDPAVPGPDPGDARREGEGARKTLQQSSWRRGSCRLLGDGGEYKERHVFERHGKGWGAAHTGPGIRFICDSDAVDDADHKGFWTTLGLWNRWRHYTYKEDREAEKEFLDQLPAAPEPVASAAARKKEPPEIKLYFAVVDTQQKEIETRYDNKFRPTKGAAAAEAGPSS